MCGLYSPYATRSFINFILLRRDKTAAGFTRIMEKLCCVSDMAYIDDVYRIAAEFEDVYSMQSQNPFLDEMAKLTSSAMSLAQAAGEEAKAAMRAQADRFVADMDLVRRDEIDALKAEIAALREEVAQLKGARATKTKPADPAAGI